MRPRVFWHDVILSVYGCLTKGHTADPDERPEMHEMIVCSRAAPVFMFTLLMQSSICSPSGCALAAPKFLTLLEVVILVAVIYAHAVAPATHCGAQNQKRFTWVCSGMIKMYLPWHTCSVANLTECTGEASRCTFLT
jgi:hypothetical protein